MQWTISSAVCRPKRKPIMHFGGRFRTVYVFIEFDIPRQLMRLITMCLNEACHKVWISRCLIYFLLRLVLNKELLCHHCFSVLP